MKKSAVLKLLLLIFLLAYQTSYAGENAKFPKWINDLRLNVDKALLVESTISNTNEPDFLRDGVSF